MVQKPLTDKEIFWKGLKGELTAATMIHNISLYNEGASPVMAEVYYDGDKWYDLYIRENSQTIRDIHYYVEPMPVVYLELFDIKGGPIRAKFSYSSALLQDSAGMRYYSGYYTTKDIRYG